jgi:hypothetical protein
MKPFTTITAILLLIGAAAHAYRLYTGMAVTMNGETISMTISWVAAIGAAFLGIMLLVESRR